MLIRRETPADVDAIRTVTSLAFRNGPEAPLVDWLRADEGWIPEFSLVADGVIGHVVGTRGYIGEDFPALGIGPLSDAPGPPAPWRREGSDARRSRGGGGAG